MTEKRRLVGLVDSAMTIATLWDSPVLAPIAEAGLAVGLNVTLFGSVASRALLWSEASIKAKSLFDLAPHLSDIDLAHDGPPSSTVALRAALEAIVPMAPWFRWSVVDRKGLAEIDRLVPTNIRVPLRELRLGTLPQGQIEKTANVIQRALEGEVDIVGNEAFNNSPRADKDTETSAALIYLHAFLDVNECLSKQENAVQPEVSRKLYDIMEQGHTRLSRLSESGRALALQRLWYLFSGLEMRLPGASLLFEDWFALPLHSLFHDLGAAGYPAAAFSTKEQAPLLVSSRLDTGQFRTPFRVEGGNFGDRDDELGELLNLSIGKDDSGLVELADGNTAIAAIRSIELRKGNSPSSVATGPLAQEFVHIRLPAANGELTDVAPERLTPLVFGFNDNGAIMIPANASVYTPAPHQFSSWPLPFPHGPDPETCTIRLDLSAMPSDCQRMNVMLVKGDFVATGDLG